MQISCAASSARSVGMSDITTADALRYRSRAGPTRSADGVQMISPRVQSRG